jgi:hypothetical protein
VDVRAALHSLEGISLNSQQARIRALLEDAADVAASAREVDLVTQAELLNEGYDLRALNRDLSRLHNN